MSLHETEENLQELTRYVLSVDRRLFAVREFEQRPLLQASDIAEKAGRSLQNISRALKELEEKKIVVCINPDSRTWRRYVLSETGKQVLDVLRDRELL